MICGVFAGRPVPAAVPVCIPVAGWGGRRRGAPHTAPLSTHGRHPPPLHARLAAHHITQTQGNVIHPVSPFQISVASSRHDFPARSHVVAMRITSFTLKTYLFGSLLWCGSGSGSCFSTWCGSVSYLSLWWIFGSYHSLFSRFGSSNAPKWPSYASLWCGSRSSFPLLCGSGSTALQQNPEPDPELQKQGLSVVVDCVVSRTRKLRLSEMDHSCSRGIWPLCGRPIRRVALACWSALARSPPSYSRRWRPTVVATSVEDLSL